MRPVVATETTPPPWLKRWPVVTRPRRGAREATARASWLHSWQREVGDAVIPLHDRLIPGTRGNIDHIFVAPTGVWVVDAKAYKGKVEKREVGPIWRRDNEVFVGGRNRSALAKGVEKQVAAVTRSTQTRSIAQGH